MFSTFFEAKHLKAFNFNEEFCATVNRMYNEAIDLSVADQNNPDTDIKNLNKTISLEEIEKNIKQISSSGKSFDNMSFHPAML